MATGRGGSGDGRTRTWAFTVYPESAAEDWRDVLEETVIPAAISPLHDRDTWTERDEARNPEHKAGEPKKPHHHVVLYYGGKKSARQVLSDLEPLGIGYVEPVRDTQAYNRYLCHLDNPNKAQYSPEDVVRLNGAACDLTRTLTAEQRRTIKAEVTRFVRANSFTEYSELVFWCLDNEPDWATVVMAETIYFRGLLASVRAVNSHVGTHTARTDGGGTDG